MSSHTTLQNQMNPLISLFHQKTDVMYNPYLLSFLALTLLLSYLYHLSSKLSVVDDERNRLSTRLFATEVEKQEKDRIITKKDIQLQEKDSQLQEKEKEIRELWVKKESVVQDLVSNINMKDKEYRSIADLKDQELRDLRSKHTSDISDLREKIDYNNKLCDTFVKGIVSFNRLLQARGDSYLLQASYEYMGSHVKEYSPSISIEWCGLSSSSSPPSPPSPLPSHTIQSALEMPIQLIQPIQSIPTESQPIKPSIRIRRPIKAPNSM